MTRGIDQMQPRGRNVSRLARAGARLCAGVTAIALLLALGVAMAPGSALAAERPEGVGADAAAKRSGGILKRLGSLDRSLRRSNRQLRKTDVRALRKLLRVSRTRIRKGRTCSALGALKRFVVRTKRVKGKGRQRSAELGGRARALGRRIFLAGRRRSSCGMRAPRVRVSRSLKPAHASLPPVSPGGKPRPVVAMGGRRGSVDFVADELVVMTNSTGKLNRLLRRYRGKVLKALSPRRAGLKAPATYLVKIDPSRANPRRLSRNLRRLNPISTGKGRVSSRRALGTLAAAVEASGRGITVGVNWIQQGAQEREEGDLILRDVSEGDVVGTGGILVDPQPGGRNPFEWHHMSRDGKPGIGTAEAWRALEIAGKLGNKTNIAILDSGFAPSEDYPPGSDGADGIANTTKCVGPGGSSDCPYHGTGVAQVAGGVVGNGLGTAGSGGPVARLRMARTTGDIFGVIERILAQVSDGVRIINMSGAEEIDAFLTPPLLPLNMITQTVHQAGFLMIAAAGQTKNDVDYEDCLPVCFEEELVIPCEFAGIMCVGGIAKNSTSKHESSNWGYEWCGESPCDVDIFAPYQVYVGKDPLNPGNRREEQGTSYSAPYMAGVAALVWAADPNLSAEGVAGILYDTAKPSSDERVGRYVDALRAVRKALGEVAPRVIITKPVDGASPGFGENNTTMVFSAISADVEDDACCEVTWTSDRDGYMGKGETIGYTFKTHGTHVVTATAVDRTGRVGVDRVTIVGGNTPPVVTIHQPKPNQTLYRGLNRLRGEGFDYQDLSLPCSSLKWSLRRGGSLVSTHTGCALDATFGSNGSWTVTLTGKDSDGATRSSTVPVTVTDPPAIPEPTIHEPNDGAFLQTGRSHTLRGSAKSSSTAPISYQWAVNYGGSDQVIGNGQQIEWTPDVVVSCDQSYEATLKLRASNTSGSKTASIRVRVGNDTPC
jgi:serine protease